MAVQFSVGIEVVDPNVILMTPVADILAFPKRIEEAGRTCYRSEDRAGADTDEKFCRMLIRRGHESVLEHCQVSAKITCDRSTSHQIVRHRLCAFSQESQRYVAYDGAPLQVIRPPVFEKDHPEFDNTSARAWESAVEFACRGYKELRSRGVKPENARSILPNCTATRLVMSANIRQWRHVFVERALNKRAQHQIRLLMKQLLDLLHEMVPCLFFDLYEQIDQ